MKPNPKYERDLAIEDNVRHQRRIWLLQRTAWCVFGAVLMAALLGFFGRGGFSHQQKTSSDKSLTLEYERFLHIDSPASLTLSVRHHGRDDMVEIWITHAYLESVLVQEVLPEPMAVRSEVGRFVYQFSVSKTNSVFPVKFSLQPEKPGSLSGLVGTVDGSTLSFKQFVYP